MLGDLGEGPKHGFVLDRVLSGSGCNSMTRNLSKPICKVGEITTVRAILSAVDILCNCLCATERQGFPASAKAAIRCQGLLLTLFLLNFDGLTSYSSDLNSNIHAQFPIISFFVDFCNLFFQGRGCYMQVSKTLFSSIRPSFPCVNQKDNSSTCQLFALLGNDKVCRTFHVF